MKKINPGDYLSGLNIDVMRFGLEAVTNLLSRFGDPQNDYPAILIGGTNGKGSTAAMTASILHRAGYRVGLYTSPHLVDVRERIVVSGRKISRRQFADILSEIHDLAADPVTYFEVLTAAAFIYFRRRQVDIAVMEVGLGGRLDATNVCHPLVSVITSIGLEHTAYLGKTLTAIAGEKAGIIKPCGICVTGATQEKALRVLEACCRRQQATLYRLGREIGITFRTDGSFGYRGIKKNWERLEPALHGRHQAANAALALAAVEVAATKGFPVDDQAVNEGLKQTHWEARMEILSDRPVFLLDGAHNPSGISMLVRTLREDYPGKRLILILAVLQDKDYRTMLKKILPLASVTIIPQLVARRALAADDLAREARAMGFRAFAADSAREAVLRALRHAKKSDVICAAGSLYLAGEIKTIISSDAFLW